jgi:YVTN family beta-propeller protein
VASALYGAHAEQHKPAKAATFGYVSNAVDDTVSVIATNNNTVVATIPVGAAPRGVATTPDGTHAYVANEFNNTVSVIDTADNTVVATIPVGQDPNGVAITPNGTRPSEDDDRRHHTLAYVTNAVDNTVSVIDTASNAVVATISVGAVPQGVAITPDGTLAYVTNAHDNTVSAIDTDNNTVVATIPVGQGPDGVAITPDGTHAYVTNFSESTVSVIDTARNKVVATMPVGLAPNGVAITQDGTHPSEHDDLPHPPLAYVANFDDNTVSVIDTANNKVVATVPVGFTPIAVAFATVTPSHSSSEQ